MFPVARTQKGRGILLSKVKEHHAFRVLIQEEEHIPYEEAFETWTVFARPCPKIPRHGFVESRIVRSRKEVADLLNEVKVADPEGEIVLLPYIQSLGNAVLTPRSIAIGEGHDGATGGKPGCIYLPIAHVELDWARKWVDQKDEPYIEAVVIKGHGSDANSFVRLTQVRGGPNPPDVSKDWIAKETKVGQVIEAGGDHLAWEKLMVEAPVGTVVYHPGATILSHYAVHANLHGIPVMFSRKPRVGETLKPTGVAEIQWSQRDFRYGLLSGLSFDLTGLKGRSSAVWIILFVLHQSAALLTQPVGSWASGLACALMIRLGYAAALGEYRHAIYGNELSRDEVYGRALSSRKSFMEHHEKVGYALWSFKNLKWGKGHGSGFGGKLWAKCTSETIKLETLSTEKRVNHKALLATLNVCVNLAHNNGWWLNKFARQEMFDTMAKGDVVSVLGAAWNFRQAYKEAVPARRKGLDAFMKKWRKVSGVSDIREPNVTFKYTVIKVVDPKLLKKEREAIGDLASEKWASDEYEFKLGCNCHTCSLRRSRWLLDKAEALRAKFGPDYVPCEGELEEEENEDNEEEQEEEEEEEEAEEEEEEEEEEQEEEEESSWKSGPALAPPAPFSSWKKHLRACVRQGNILHVQWGKLNAYRKLDIKLTEQGMKEWVSAAKNWNVVTSLADTPTPYWEVEGIEGIDADFAREIVNWQSKQTKQPNQGF